MNTRIASIMAISLLTTACTTTVDREETASKISIAADLNSHQPPLVAPLEIVLAVNGTRSKWLQGVSEPTPLENPLPKLLSDGWTIKSVHPADIGSGGSTLTYFVLQRPKGK